MRERLLHLREFGGKGYPMFPSLADLALKYLKRDLSAGKQGDDIWRMKYGTLDGVPFDGGKGSDFSLTLGSGTFIPGFEDGLIGAKAGDSVAADEVLVEFG
jgi:trigger factor